MNTSQLDPQLVERLKLVEEPDYEGESLTGKDCSTFQNKENR